VKTTPEGCSDVWNKLDERHELPSLRQGSSQVAEHRRAEVTVHGWLWRGIPKGKIVTFPNAKLSLT